MLYISKRPVSERSLRAYSGRFLSPADLVLRLRGLGLEKVGQALRDVQLSEDAGAGAVLVSGLSSSVDRVLSYLSAVDLVPRQVLLSVVVAEVQDDDSRRLGVAWSKISDPSVSFGVPSLGVASGLKIGIDAGGRILASVQALASSGRIRVMEA